MAVQVVQSELVSAAFPFIWESSGKNPRQPRFVFGDGDRSAGSDATAPRFPISMYCGNAEMP